MSEDKGGVGRGEEELNGRTRRFMRIAMFYLLPLNLPTRGNNIIFTSSNYYLLVLF